MKPALLLFFLISVFSGGINAISRINEYARRAAAAYRQGEYVEAVAAYEYLVHDLEVRDDHLQLNLAHAYYRAALWPQAQEAYRLLATHPSRRLRAVAHLQLGNIATEQKKYRQALALYKTALIAEPENDAARYNYELLKKYTDLHPETPKDTLADRQTAPEGGNAGEKSHGSPPPAADEPEPRPKKKPDAGGNAEEETEQPAPALNGQQQQNAGAGSQSNGRSSLEGSQERGQQSGSQAGDTEGLTPEGQAGTGQQQRSSAESVQDEDVRAQTRRARLQQMNMSPEKARLLLDAMRSAELQYIQQLPKKSTRTPDRSRPDW